MIDWYKAHEQVYRKLLNEMIGAGGRKTLHPMDSHTAARMQQMLVVGWVVRPEPGELYTFEITQRGRDMAESADIQP